MELLLLPSARWNGRAWVDENDLEYPSEGSKSLGKCPRRIGLVSQGLVVRGMADAVNQLLCRRYTCVIVDEAHRARRRNVPKVDAEAFEIDERAEPNKLMAFLREIGPRTKSMLLATATPVQLHPVEAWDLLHILSHGNDSVLGGRTQSSPWFRPSYCLEIATGDASVPTSDVHDGWEYVRDPLPSRFEDKAFDRIRRNLDASDNHWQFNPETLDKLSPAIRRVQLRNGLLPDYGERFNPLLRCIVRRTLLLRRLGSSMEAGRRTVQRLLGEVPDLPDDEDDDDADEEAPVQIGRPPQGASDFKNFTDAELNSLHRCLELLKQGGNNDPKLEAAGRLSTWHPSSVYRPLA